MAHPEAKILISDGREIIYTSGLTSCVKPLEPQPLSPFRPPSRRLTGAGGRSKVTLSKVVPGVIDPETAAVDGLSNWRPSQPRRRLEHVVGPLGSCSRRRHAAGADASCANRRNLPGPDDRDLGDKARLDRHHASSRRLSHLAGQLVERHQRLLSTPVHDFVERRPRADRERGGPCVF